MSYLAFEIYITDEVERYQMIAMADTLGSMGAEENDDHIIIYFGDGVQQSRMEEIINSFQVRYEVKTIPHQNWNTLWESNFDPVYVDDFCYIKADFHPDIEGIPHIIRITPKMAFGTGHHATTYQVIQMMKSLNWIDKKVLDFGTGTGILAILAEQLGARDILAIDNDPWSVENTIEHIEKNQSKRIKARISSIEDVSDQDFDIIIANINRHILLQYMPLISQKTKKNGYVIISGILSEDRSVIEKSIIENNLKILDTTEKDNWLCILLTKIG